MNEPQTSIIIPCYNVEPYVKQCIDSVLASTYRNIQVIVVNDGSQDGTADVLAAYEDRKNVRLITQENKGLSAARNRGLQEAMGKYVMFVDSDDWIEASCVEKAVGAMEERRADLLVFGIMMAVQRFGSPEIRSPQGIKMPECSSSDEVLYSAFAGLIGLSKTDVDIWNRTGNVDRLKVHGYACAKLYRRDILEEYGIRFDELIVETEDVFFNLSYMLRCSRISCLDEALYYYRIRADGTNTVANVDRFPFDTYRHKMAALNARNELRAAVQEERGIDIVDMYCGSLALSSIEVALCCAREPRLLGRRAYKKYLNKGVIEAAGRLPLYFGNLKFNVPLALLKTHLPGILYALIRVLVLLRLDGRVVASGVKRV